MSFSITSAINSVSVFAGVNAGFDSETFAVTEPLEAAKCIKQALNSLDIEAGVYPGRVLYAMDRGCPIGGEVMGVIFTSNSPDILDKMELLRTKLQQQTLSVITSPETGRIMPGFVVNFGPGNLLDIAKIWQQNAAQKYAISKFHVSAAIYEFEGGIYAQAEANPTRIKNIETWREDAKEIVENISSSAIPLFREVGYHFLH